MINMKGYSLIELLVVITIIGILATLSIPSHLANYTKPQIQQGILDATYVQSVIEHYYSITGVLPTNNIQAHISIIHKGVVQILFSSKPPQRANPILDGKSVFLIPDISLSKTTIIPFDPDDPNSSTSTLFYGPIFWHCASNIDRNLLPITCVW